MENHAIYLIVAMVAIPCIIGALYAWLTRPSKHYYKLNGYRWEKK